MAHEAFFADIDYFAEDLTPDTIFGGANLSGQPTSTNIDNVNLNGDHNQFQDTNTGTIIQDVNTVNGRIIDLEEDPDIPSAEALEIAAYLDAYNNDNQDEEENPIIGEHMDLHQNNVINPQPLPCLPAMKDQNMAVPMSPMRFGGDGNFSSPDHHKAGDNGFGPINSPPPVQNDTVMVGQDEPGEVQANDEQKLESKTSTSVNAGVVEASNVESGPTTFSREQLNQAIFSLARSMAADIDAGFPPMDLTQVFPYIWTTMVVDPRVPPVLKTKEAFEFIQSMATQGGNGLAVGLTSEQIMALPIIQQFLNSVMHPSQTYPGTVTVHGNLAATGSYNTGFTTNDLHQPMLPTNFAAHRSGPRTTFSTTAVNNLIELVGGPGSFRKRYISWRSISLRPVAIPDQSTINVLGQPDVGDFLRSLDVSMSLNTFQPSTPIGTNGHCPAGNNVQTHQQSQPAVKASSRRSRQGPTTVVDNQHNSLPDPSTANEVGLPSSEEMNTVYGRYINAWRNHPAAVNTNNPVLDMSYTDIMARRGDRHRQGAGTPLPVAAKPPKAAPRKKTPVKLPAKIHPNAVLMYRHFGHPIPTELPELGEEFEDFSEEMPESNAAQSHQNSNIGNTFQPSNVIPSKVSTVATARATKKMNAHQHTSASVRMTTEHMLEIQELKRIIAEQENTIANQSRVIQAQSGAIQANKYMLETVLAKFNGNQENPAYGNPVPATVGISGHAYTGLVPSIETTEDHPFVRKRSDSASESSSLSKRRRGVAGLAIKAPANENRESCNMDYSRPNSSVGAPPVYRGHEELYKLGSQNAGVAGGIATTSEVVHPRLASATRSRRAVTANTHGSIIKTSAGKVHHGSKQGDQEETSEESNEPADSSGSDYIPPAGV